MSRTNNGFIILSRSIIKSPIFKKPPLYTQVWVYLLSRAQHADYKGLKRGQLVTSIDEIQKACTYYVGARKEIPTKRQVFTILEWLRYPKSGLTKCTPGVTATEPEAEPMIATAKVTHGMLVNIVNYAFYQNPDNYESNAESNKESKHERNDEKDATCNNINKNVLLNKNDIYNIPFFPDFWEAFGYKTDKLDAAKAFKSLRVDEPLYKVIIEGVDRLHNSRSWKAGFKTKPDNWLKGRKWEDEGDSQNNNSQKVIQTDENTFRIT